MKDTTKKVVILDNFTSPYIYQAIIVLNDNIPSNSSHVIADAEKIVSDYLLKLNADEQEITLYTRPHIKQSKKSRLPYFIACSLMALCAVCLFLLLR